PVHDAPATARANEAGDSSTAGGSTESSPPGLASLEEPTTTAARVVATPGAEETGARVARPKEASVPVEVAIGAEKPASETRVNPPAPALETRVNPAEPPLVAPKVSGTQGPDSMAAKPAALVDDVRVGASRPAPGSAPD